MLFGWYVYACNGDHDEGTFVDNKKHGEWIERDSSGNKEKGQYIEGEKDGTWLVYDRSENKCWYEKYRRDDNIIRKKEKKRYANRQRGERSR